jgi:hypothetical protein
METMRCCKIIFKTILKLAFNYLYLVESIASTILNSNKYKEYFALFTK